MEKPKKVGYMYDHGMPLKIKFLKFWVMNNMQQWENQMQKLNNSLIN